MPVLSPATSSTSKYIETRQMADTRLSKRNDLYKTSERGYWTSNREFILSCIGYAVGLSNIWRFPYLCMRNGGGAFLIPYFIFMLIVGIPLTFMEFSLGQYSRESAGTVFKMCPLFLGIGFSIVAVNLVIMIYYNTILAWVIYYLINTFRSWEPLWSKCNNAWNTPYCRIPGEVWNQTRLASKYNDTVHYALIELTDNTGTKTHSAGQEFWQYNVLNLSSGMEDLGGLRWQLVLCLMAAWAMVFLCVIKGFRSSGKVVYVTATVPYVFLIVILIRGLTLPGSRDGILFYITPTWEKILSFRIWCEACLQILYSLGPGWGGMITMASYNKFCHNCYRDAILIPIINSFTSFLAGFVIFSIIGHIAYEGHVTVDQAVTSGPGLAFVTYPEALSKIPGAPIWSALFFLMLLSVGLDSQFVYVENIVSAAIDRFPDTFRNKRIYILIGVVLVGFSFGLVFVCRAGVYWFQIVDWYACTFTVIIITILECAVVSYIYGINRFCQDISFMLGRTPLTVWKISWCLLTPLMLLVCLLYAFATVVAPTYGNYKYPFWAIGFGWSLAILTTIPIVIVFIRKLVVRKGKFKERLHRACQPDPSWLPRLDEETARRLNYPLLVVQNDYATQTTV